MGMKIKLRGSASPREVKSKVHLTSAWRFVVLIQSGQTKAFFSHKERKGRKEDKNIKIVVCRVLIGDKKKTLCVLCALCGLKKSLWFFPEMATARS